MFGILIFGDSITFGRGETPSVGWVGRLKQYFESQDSDNCLYNLGIPGDNSTGLLKRFNVEVSKRIKHIRKEDKFIVCIAIGINDTRGLGAPDNYETKPKEFKKNIQKLITKAKKLTKDVVLIGLTPVNEEITSPFEKTYFSNDVIKKFNKIISDCSKENNLFYINVFDDFYSKNYKTMLTDGLHPNSKGYEFLYKQIKDSLIKFKLIK